MRLGWYGDDFTGATDTLAVAAQAGLRCALFLDIPEPRQMIRMGGLDALGIAGSARTMSPQAMRQELPRIGAFFKTLQVSVLHYKCCSTFDSSPKIGSIGAALSILDAYVDRDTAYVVGGQPDIGRYCCFSNLFAAAGAGGKVCRLDRHPTMTQHPVTPMGEADLRLHLGQQWAAPIEAVHYPSYGLPEDEFDGQVDATLQDLKGAGPAAVLFDIADRSHLGPLGRQIWRQARQGSLLVAGPSSVVQALAAHWGPGIEPAAPPAGRKDPGAVFVFAGSMSPVTARQVEQAGSYRRLPLGSRQLISDPSYLARQIESIAGLLDAGSHVLAYVEAGGPRTPDVCSDDLALVTAELVKRVVERQAAGPRPLLRLGVAGGDTSSRAAKALDIWALSFVRVLSPGVALCRAHSDDPVLNGMELMLKGGQMGSADIFEQLLQA
ncbi:four-carbon acid sugar kinase family protein [Paralcaligenes sp. KSB-10]|jgi:uncharacterized protein YgbK (DUF1537 family)|uniref:four-carbon acid sugar kinase family protein n=1 Tax=Paralcaligenes sp. KSB-10 TaxID=2901142 RepID=UPI001E2C62AD|nr:four-carbon acid sugar kinase family protein [Paralcaligenes sp. KSB-10]UHL64591.1 four-carbon acid sugar kinase family protein [Paralcaligenes sp. KSB-10]